MRVESEQPQSRLLRPQPEAGDIINGWRLVREVDRRNTNRLFVVVCPRCRREFERTPANCRVAAKCHNCARKERIGRTYQKGKKEKLSFVVNPCCTDRRCPVCAGLNRRVDMEKGGDR